MRRDTGINEFRRKVYIASIATIIGVILIVVGFTIYSKSLNNNAKQSTLDAQKIAELVPSEDDSESASTEFGKTVEESEETSDNSNENESEVAIELGTNTDTSTKNNQTNTQATNTTNKTNTTNNTNTTTKTNSTAKNTQKVEEQKEETKNLTFIAPVEGEIIKEFATDTLVYSATLEEWITHNGIDIKADKTTVVKAAADGTVKTIKNDPRYGLTVTIEHDNGFKTVYANLLTSEFVSEGEKVKSGQTIGTVGNTATFEIADETHLHFEMLKDDKYVDPGVYMK